MNYEYKNDLEISVQHGRNPAYIIRHRLSHCESDRQKFPKAMKAVTRFAWKIFHESVWTAMERPIYTKHGLMIEDRTR